MHWIPHIFALSFPVWPPARLPCVTWSSSLVISDPGDSICPSEGSGSAEWPCESSPGCVPVGAPLSSCGVPEWGREELLIRQTDIGPCAVLSHPSWYQKRRVQWPTGNHWHPFSKLGFLTQFSEISNVYGQNSLLEVLKASKNLHH